MSKRNKGNHGIYSLTCISQKCGRKFGVMWELKNCVEVGVTGRKLKTGYWTLEEAKMGVLVYPFNGCPFCGAWWCTGPLDAAAYPPPPPLLGHRHVVCKKPRASGISGDPVDDSVFDSAKFV